MNAIKQNYVYISLMMMVILLLGQCNSCSKMNTATKKVKQLTLFHKKKMDGSLFLTLTLEII